MSNLVTRLLVPLLLITVSEAIGCVLDQSPTSDLDAVRVVRYSATKGSSSDKAWITIGDHSYRESVLLGSGVREWWIENTDKPVKVCYSTGEYQISSNSQRGQLYHLEAVASSSTVKLSCLGFGTGQRITRDQDYLETLSRG